MRVTNDKPISGSSRARRSDSGRGGADFRALVSEDPAPVAAGVSQVRATAALDAVLFAQQADPDQAGREQASRRGRALLDRLDDIRLGLLTGVIPRERLSQLAAMVRAERAAVPDPRLAAVLDEIELRAQVELAKLRQGVSAGG